MTIMYDDEVMISTQGMYNNKKSNFAGEDVYYGPNNKKAAPCDSCPLADTCKYECKAFTAWCDTGNYWEGGYVTKQISDQPDGWMCEDSGPHLKDGIMVVTETKWKPSDVGVFKKSAKKVA